jgi:hypothetical protein
MCTQSHYPAKFDAKAEVFQAVRFLLSFNKAINAKAKTDIPTAAATTPIEEEGSGVRAAAQLFTIGKWSTLFSSTHRHAVSLTRGL